MQRIDQLIAAAAVKKDDAGQWRTRLKAPGSIAFAPGERWRARMTTSKGELAIELLPATAPAHVTSFAFLSRLGFYDGLTFHRVIPGFMAQGGCPLGSGTGGPGYRFDGEFDPSVNHDRPGLLSMANAGPGTDGSQFFLTFVPTPWLDGKHTIFGRVEGGADVLAALERCGSPAGRPSERLVMERVTVEALPAGA
ncbi:MAG TPA: peptidylprolyl isomerase [Candidatus Acidoferrales bacterium]|nr:peptidylprolyl isomerase [Candidatus Acidoferrales bacterium]